MEIIRIPPGNIWSGDPMRAIFTNPTEIAYRKGTLKHHYPVTFRNKVYADAEQAYKIHKPQSSNLYNLCTEIIVVKLEQYPFLVDIIEANGDEEWIKRCSHHVYDKCKFWEGDGLKSGFIRCLLTAYKIAITKRR